MNKNLFLSIKNLFWWIKNIFYRKQFKFIEKTNFFIHKNGIFIISTARRDCGFRTPIGCRSARTEWCHSKHGAQQEVLRPAPPRGRCPGATDWRRLNDERRVAPRTTNWSWDDPSANSASNGPKYRPCRWRRPPRRSPFRRGVWPLLAGDSTAREECARLSTRVAACWVHCSCEHTGGHRPSKWLLPRVDTSRCPYDPSKCEGTWTKM